MPQKCISLARSSPDVRDDHEDGCLPPAQSPTFALAQRARTHSYKCTRRNERCVSVCTRERWLRAALTARYRFPARSRAPISVRSLPQAALEQRVSNPRLPCGALFREHLISTCPSAKQKRPLWVQQAGNLACLCSPPSGSRNYCAGLSNVQCGHCAYSLGRLVGEGRTAYASPNTCTLVPAAYPFFSSCCGNN